MLLKNYTDKTKKNHLMRYYPKSYLFEICDGCIDGLEKIKTKKELIEKHLDLVWELVIGRLFICIKEKKKGKIL